MGKITGKTEKSRGEKIINYKLFKRKISALYGKTA